jgi:hypothetical protein
MESLAPCYQIVGFCAFSALPHDNFCHSGVAKIVSTANFVELRQKLSACRASLGEKKRDAEASRSLDANP